MSIQLVKRAVQVRAFRSLWAAETLSLLGQQISLLALPLIATVTLQATPIQMGLLVAFETAPLLLLSLLAGVWIDRYPRRQIMLWSDILRAISLLSIPVAFFFGLLTMELLYITGLCIGTLSLFFNVAYQALIPETVPKTLLVDANSKLEISRSGAEVLGPGISGFLITLFGSVTSIWLNVFTFLTSALFLKNISPLGEQSSVLKTKETQSIVLQIREGLNFLWNHQTIRPLVLYAASLNFIHGLVDALLLLHLSRELGLLPAQIGLFYTISNFGFILGAFLVNKIVRYMGIKRSIFLAASVEILAMLFLVFSAFIKMYQFNNTLVILLLIFFRALTSFGGVIYSVQHISLRQTIVPSYLQGRVHASVRFLAGGVVPLGALLGGVLAQNFGIDLTLFLTGIVGFSTWILLNPLTKLRDGSWTT